MTLFGLGWFAFALLSSILVSLVGLLQKIALKDESVDPIAFSIYIQLLVGLFSLPFAIYSIGSLPISGYIWALVLLMALSYAGASLVYYKALKLTELSQVKILSSTRSLWVLLGSFVFLGELFTTYKVVGIIFVVLGVIVVYWQRSGIKGFGFPQMLVLLYAGITACSAILDKYLLVYFDSVPTYQVLAFILPAILTVLFFPGSISKIKPLLRLNKNNFFIILSALLLNIATFVFYYALNIGGQISIAGAIWQSSTIFSVLLGIIFLNEKNNLNKKIFGSIIVVLGIILLKYGL